MAKRRVARRHHGSSRAFFFERLESRALLAVSPALLNSWFVSGQGEFAKVYVGQPGGAVTGPSTTWSGQSTAVLGDVQKVSASTTTNTVYINTPDLASYVMGAWWGNAAQTQPFINLPKDQNAIYKITLNTTYPSATHSVAGGGPIGIAVNGVVFYNAGDAFSYAHATSNELTGGDGLFNRLAAAVEAVTFDVGGGHQPGNGQYHYHENPPALRAQLGDNIDYIGTTNYFPYDPGVYYLTQGQGADGDFREHATDLHHSPIIGWMFDGYPIYGPYGYSSATDSASAVARMRSSFSLRSITDRVTLPGWAAQLSGGKLGPTAANTAADGVYTMTSTQQSNYAGPAVSATYPLGRYGEDYAYVPGSGDLDQFNGRWCKTPEFPNGTYAYFLTIDSAGEPAFPYVLNRQYYGQKNGSGVVASITETVTVPFNVATNTAPVMSGPATVTAVMGSATPLAGGSLVSLFDVDEAAVESVALSVTAGSLNLDLSGPLAGRVSIASGANHSATLTISGAVDELNAALATLTYTAPSSGTTATLTVQANDGSVANNLSTTLSTTITLSPIVNMAVAASQTVVDSTARSGAVEIVKQGTGTLVLSAAATFTGGVVVEQGEVVVRNVAALGSGQLTVRAGAKATLDVGTGTVSISGLALDAAGRLDLGTGRLEIASGGFTESTIRSRIMAGLGDGSWNGTNGITSASAAADTSGTRCVGYVIDSGIATVAFAAVGDTNLDGAIDLADLLDLIGSGKYDSPTAGSWVEGDFNYDAAVDLGDLLSLVGTGLYDAGPYPATPNSGAMTTIALTTSSTDPLLLSLALGDTSSGTSTTAKKKPL